MDRHYNSPYALSKGVNEDYANLFNTLRTSDDDTTFIGLRYFNVYGPRQDPKSPYSGVMSIFLDKIQSNIPIAVFGTGTQTRDFVYVMDVVEANLRAARCNIPPNSTTLVYNVGTGVSNSLLDIIRCIEKVAKKTSTVHFHEPRLGDVEHSLADISKIITEFGYHPVYSLEEGISNMLLQNST
jgi:UDP-glucose 4-epimerase